MALQQRNSSRLSGMEAVGFKPAALAMFLAIGFAAGFVAHLVTGGDGGGFARYLVTGLVGAFVGGYLFSALNISLGMRNTLFNQIATSTVGAVVVMLLAKVIAA